jgi:hypothetical protein
VADLYFVESGLGNDIIEGFKDRLIVLTCIRRDSGKTVRTNISAENIG